MTSPRKSDVAASRESTAVFGFFVGRDLRFMAQSTVKLGKRSNQVFQRFPTTEQHLLGQPSAEL